MYKKNCLRNKLQGREREKEKKTFETLFEALMGTKGKLLIPLHIKHAYSIS